MLVQYFWTMIHGVHTEDIVVESVVVMK